MTRSTLTRPIVATAAIGLLVLTGCSSAQDESPSAAATTPAATAAATDTSFLDEFGLDGSDPRAIVTELDQTNDDRDSGVMGSVRYDSVVFVTDEGEKAVPIEDEFYLAVAPYVDQTHDCYYHNLATCQGELVGEDLEVTITTDDGEVLVDETATTYDNGFVGFWLPRDITGTIEIAHDGKSVTAPIATGPEDPTCVTTLQLT
ncbi:MAG: CueP family metal-binding protein [Dermatophilaceae bacterium]